MVEERKDLESELRDDLPKAVEYNELFLHYQPLIDVKKNRIYGIEALIRWNHPKRGIISPDVFIPIAEESNLISKIGEWVLRESIHHFQHIEKDGMNSMKLLINLSVVQLQDPQFIPALITILNDTDIDPTLLEFEVTESIFMEKTDQLISNLNYIKKIGVRLSIDDFGTGYSSLSYLKDFHFHTLKIDRSFVKTIHDSTTKLLIESIISLGKKLNMTVIGEGVETEEQRLYLLKNHCDIMQGYLFSKPLDSQSLFLFLNKKVKGRYV